MNRHTIGIDCGSRSIKVVLFDIDQEQIVDYLIESTGINPSKTIRSSYQSIILKNKLEEKSLKNIVATGYGRNLVSFANLVSSEIHCHAKGVLYFNDQIRTVIDIGGQDSKMIQINEQKKVTDFVMNDKCAAGTGRFLEKTADIFQTDLEEIDKIGLGYKGLLEISSVCVVFAESEIIGLINTGQQASDIIASVYHSIARRVRTMGSHLDLAGPIGFVGGVARNKLMGNMLELEFNRDIYVPANPTITGALGAALTGFEKYIKD